MYLDDLELIQENGLGMVRLLLKGLTGVDGGYLLRPCEVTVAASSGVTTYTMGENALVYEGRILVLDGGEWDSEHSPMYVCVRRGQTDVRTFGNGEQHACREAVEAYLSNDPEGAEWHGQVDLLRSLPELLAREQGAESETFDWVEIQDGQVTMKNGYHGTLKYSRETPLRLKIDVKTEAKDWDSNVDDRGVIGTITDQQLAQLLDGVTTVNFVQCPKRPDDSMLWPGGCMMEVSDGKIMINCMATGSGGLTWGVPGANGMPDVKPCGADDNYATVVATLTR